MFSKLKSIFQSNNVETFIGLIDEKGAVISYSEDKRTVLFNFCAYFDNQGKYYEKPITVFKEFLEEQETNLDLDALSIIKISGRTIQFSQQKQIQFTSVIQTNVKHEILDKLIEERSKPTIFSSEYFGEFILDRRLNWFEKKTQWLGNEIDLFLSIDTSPISELESSAIKLFKDQEKWHKKLVNQITLDLLSLKNESWLEDDEKELQESEFKSRISIDSITIHPDDEFEFWFKDGDLFWGHSINIGGNLNGQLEEATING
ncbi:DUF2262 domain-containing protein [Tenacibaculum agarivorans]|uniref:DUF2262 domain-containing protein n=1 Tax=Tenacibaculum agarivorans TaxID=1908389 RepID=UPI00094B9471|nr:DUF2262 domain-containing protein [Tenacibaculum agarivorans]